MGSFIETPLNQPKGIEPLLDKNQDTVFFAGGFRNVPNGPAITGIVEAYLSISTHNVVLINWENEAKGVLPDLSGYPIAVANAKLIGVQAGKGILELIVNNILNENKIHLIGHSLGAHLVGYTGDELKKCNHEVPRITALDPTRYGFELLLQGVNSGQAKYVVAVHTDPENNGLNRNVGNADFWANCGDALQPGCPTPNISQPLSTASLCSHDRSWRIYAEAVRNSGTFPAALASCCSAWMSQTSSNVVINILGDKMDSAITGAFYFITNAQSPFSKGQAGITSN